MRTNSQFLAGLRAEIAAGQARRNTFIKLKLGFVVSLLGVGSLSIDKPVKTAPLLYLVPLVAFIFDLYTMGEDFGVKRAATFLRSSSAAPPEEVRWEKEVADRRDWFSYAAGPLSSALALVAAVLGLRMADTEIPLFLPWLGVSSLFVVFLALNRPLSRFLLREFPQNRNIKEYGSSESLDAGLDLGERKNRASNTQSPEGA